MLVEVKVVGSRRPGIEPRTVAGGPQGATTLREVIEHIVRDEVAAYNGRERDRRLIRALSREDIAAGVTTGKVAPGGRETTGPADADQAVATAVEAFGDGLYFAFVDDQQITGLQDRVVVEPDTRVRFVRLVPLAGG